MREALLFIHFIGLALGLGTGFAFMALGMAAKTLAPAERVSFFMKAFAMSRNGSIGLALLIVSGIGLMFVHGPAAAFAAGGIYFQVKLALIVILVGLIGYAQTLIAKAKRDGGGPVMAKIPKVSPFTLLTTLMITLMAVLAFH